MVVLHLPREVDLARFDVLARNRQLEQRRSRAVVGRDEHAVAADDRRRDVGDVVRHLAVAPQLPAATRRRRPSTRWPVKKIASLHFADSVRNRRGISRLVAGGRPDLLAVGLLQRDDRPAGVDEDAVFEHQRRFAEPPLDVRAAELLQDVQRPVHLAAGRVEHAEIAARAEGIDPIAVDRWRRARSVAPIVTEPRAHAPFPTAACRSRHRTRSRIRFRPSLQA